MPGPGGGPGGFGGSGRGPGGPGGPGRGPGGPSRPMGGPPPHHHRCSGSWGYRRPYRSGCLGCFLAIILGCGSLFTFMIFTIISIF